MAIATTNNFHRHFVPRLLVALFVVEILDSVPGANAGGWDDDYGHPQACNPVGTHNLGALTSERKGNLIVRLGRGVTSSQDFSCIWEIEIPNALQIVITFSMFDAFRVSDDYFWIYTNEWNDRFGNGGRYVDQSSAGVAAFPSPSEMVIEGNHTLMYYLLKAVPADARENYEWRGQFELSYRAVFADDEGDRDDDDDDDDKGIMIQSIEVEEADGARLKTTTMVVVIVIGLIVGVSVVVCASALISYREKKRMDYHLPNWCTDVLIPNLSHSQPAISRCTNVVPAMPISSRNNVNLLYTNGRGAADNLGCSNGFVLPICSPPAIGVEAFLFANEVAAAAVGHAADR